MSSSIKPREDVVTIYQGDYLSRIRHLEKRYEAALQAEKQSTATLGEELASSTLADEHEALVAEAEESALHVDVFALGRRRWRALVAEHPVRKDNQADAEVGLNEESFKDALVPLSIEYPLGHENYGKQQLTDADLDRLADVDYDRLYLTAFALNRAAVAGPKALDRHDSRQSRQSDGT